MLWLFNTQVPQWCEILVSFNRQLQQVLNTPTSTLQIIIIIIIIIIINNTNTLTEMQSSYKNRIVSH
jgi:hypothetical protein